MSDLTENRFVGIEGRVEILRTLTIPTLVSHLSIESISPKVWEMLFVLERHIVGFHPNMPVVPVRQNRKNDFHDSHVKIEILHKLVRIGFSDLATKRQEYSNVVFGRCLSQRHSLILYFRPPFVLDSWAICPILCGFRSTDRKPN